MMKLTLVTLFLILVGINAKPAVDYNTQSNFNDVRTVSYHLIWDIDFETQKIEAQIQLSMIALNKLSVVILDLWKLELPGTPNQCQFTNQKVKNANVTCLTKHISDDQGDRLSVDVFSINRAALNKNQAFNLTISYTITNQSKSLSFLTPEQTSTKKQPYLFTQNEPIYARSLAPLQDTPRIKAKWTAWVTTTKNIENVYMSAMTVEKYDKGDKTFYSFSQENPVPSYLLAIIAGNVDRKQVGPRAGVIAEPDILDLAARELADLDRYISTIEEYLDIPYGWPEYNVVIMPPSFPIGGMENPLLTFASPSIIDPSGAKTSVFVAIHEIAHSWTGNTVTCGNWSNLWLNEGFTVFLERKTGRTLFGDDFYRIESINGNVSLNDAYKSFEKEPQFTRLNPDTSTENPDDSFSEVPYEKGYQFLTYMEQVLGSSKMAELLHEWILSSFFESRIWTDFEDHFVKFVKRRFQNPEEIFEKIDFNLWVNGEGVAPKQDALNISFYSPIAQQAQTLASQFIQLQGFSKPNGWEQVKTWAPNAQQLFLQEFYLQRASFQKVSTNLKIFQLLDDSYGFSKMGNKEILWRWYRAVIYSKYEVVLDEDIFKFLGQIGRGKMIDPLYQAYMDMNKQDIARKAFSTYESFYHPIQRSAIHAIIYPKQLEMLD